MRHAHFICGVALVAATVLSGCRSDQQVAENGTNNTSSSTHNRVAELTLPSGAVISNAWNARRSADTGAVRFTNVDYNARVGAGQFTEFGFQSTGSGSGLTPTCAAA